MSSPGVIKPSKSDPMAELIQMCENNEFKSRTSAQLVLYASHYARNIVQLVIIAWRNSNIIVLGWTIALVFRIIIIPLHF